ncbi:MAG: hypothetical protein AB7O67_07045 [Vicinamibacterales bacterium]
MVLPPRRFGLLVLIPLLFLPALAVPALAQVPATPVYVSANVAYGSNMVTVEWNCDWTGNPCRSDYFVIEAVSNPGEHPLPGSPFNVGYPRFERWGHAGATSFTVTGGPLADGDYALQVYGVNQYGRGVATTATFFIRTGGGGAPGVPTILAPVVNGSTVTINWAAPTAGGAPEGYDLQALVQATGEVLNVSLGNQTAATFNGVGNGNFIVKIRARNAAGVSDWSAERVVVVGVTLGSGALQVTLTWNTEADMDLHCIEPDRNHVYYAHKQGTSSVLDVDDTNGYGPENIFVRQGQAMAGVYRFYIVHYGRSVATEAVITVRLNPGTPNEVSVLYRRNTSQPNPSQGFLVVDVDVNNGTISEVVGPIPVNDEAAATPFVKVP